MQANRKTRAGAGHPDRDAQFEYINARVNGFQAAVHPVISVDTKKKELIGGFKNQGRVSMSTVVPVMACLLPAGGGAGGVCRTPPTSGIYEAAEAALRASQSFADERTVWRQDEAVA